jgi:thioesterase domain-containing protein
MVPATVTTLAAVPVTPNGKLDRAALPTPDLTAGRAPYRAPRTHTETAVTEAFCETLDLDEIGLDDNYFALGGTSLGATGVAATLADAVARPVPVQWIFTHPTPESLARRIEEGPGDENARSLEVLLPLRETGSGDPLFCVHPAVGLAWCFAALAPHAGDRPVYGLQSPMLTDPHRPFATLTDLAADYVDHIRSVQPTGPYHLLGYSVGGQIAHEIAAQLTAAGEQIASLTMLDTHLSRGPVTPPSAELIAAETRDTAPATVTQEQFDVLRSVFTRTVELAVAHEPTRVPGDLLFFESADAAELGLPSPGDAWRAHIGGALHHHRVPVPHLHLTGAHALSHIAPVLAHHLQKGLSL